MNREIYRQKAREMRRQADRAETAFLGAMYRQMADDWELMARHTAPADESQVALPKGTA